MKKLTIEVQEILRYNREIECEIPDEMTESELEKLFERMERDEFLGDAVYVLKKAGIKVGWYDEAMDSPSYGEVEVVDFEVKDIGTNESA